MPITVEELNGPDPMTRALDKHGITPDSLARMLKEGLAAEVTKTIKVKGEVKQEDLPEGFRVVASSKVKFMDAEGTVHETAKETLITWNEISHDERRQNRIDAQRLRGAYPVEKHEMEHKGKAVLIIERTRGAKAESGNGTDPV